MTAVFGLVGIEIDIDDSTRRHSSQLLIDLTNRIRYINDFEGDSATWEYKRR